MKRWLVLVLTGGLSVSLFAFVPFYYGARSLALGQGTVGYNNDANAVYLNPSMLSHIQLALTGIQYQQQYFDYKTFTRTLASLRARPLASYESLSAAEKNSVYGDLESIFHSKTGMYGFQFKHSGYASTDYGISVAMIDEAVISPVDTTVLKKPADQLTNADIAGLKLNYLGFHYTQYTVAYSLPVTEMINLGVALHYLTGKVSEFECDLLDSRFSKETTSREYLQAAWEARDNTLSKLTMDLGASAFFARFFSLGITVRNVWDVSVTTPQRTLKLPRRMIAGLAFQSQDYWGIHLDIDVERADLYYNGKKSQPISFGVEKGFFQNLFSLRVGFLNDLTDDDFFGARSNILYGVGLGFNLTRFQVDLALALDHTGSMKSLAISGFFLIPKKSKN